MKTLSKKKKIKYITRNLSHSVFDFILWNNVYYMYSYQSYIKCILKNVIIVMSNKKYYFSLHTEQKTLCSRQSIIMFLPN